MDCWRGSNAECGLLESASLGLDKVSAGVTKCVLCCDGTIGTMFHRTVVLDMGRNAGV